MKRAPTPEGAGETRPGKSYRVAALARGLAVLSAFDRTTNGLTLAEIARATGLSKSTAFRIVRTLEEADYLTRQPETQRYRPGLKVLELGFTALSSYGVRDTARPFLEHLARETGETVSLSLLDGLEVVYIDRVRNKAIVGVVLGLGSRIPAHCASMGKAMLAHLPADELATRLDGAPLSPCTPRSIVDRDAFERELVRIRRRGYAVNDQELEVGLRAVAAPIHSRDGRVIAAINATGNTRTISRSRLTRELAPRVREAAARISRALALTGVD